MPSVRLFCLPYADAGAHLFRGWGYAVPNDVEVCPVELPGRGTRLGEAPASELKMLVRQMAAGLEPLLDLPFAIFGCSMGALIGFELARVLRQRYGQEPATLLAAAQNAPLTIPGPTGTQRKLLPDAEFEALLRGSGETTQEVLGNPRLMRLFAPMLRADYSLVDTYDYEPDEPLRCPIHLFVGTEDPTLGNRDAAGWRQETASHFAVHRFPGGHLFFRGAEDQLLASISDQMRTLG